MRIAIYARYSSDHQDERSIEDQIRLCRERACAIGGNVVGTYTDYAISGAHLKSRPDASRLLRDAQDGCFDAILTEALDRLSRDQEDIAGLYKRLRFAGVKIITLSEGEVDELHIGFKGTMNALFLRDLAAKIRRGQSGRIAAGLAAGGLSYGYRVVKKLDDRGEPMRGLREIDEEQAEVVRHLPGVCRWTVGTYDCGRTEPRQNPLSVRRRVGCFDHQRQSQTPQRGGRRRLPARLTLRNADDLGHLEPPASGHVNPRQALDHAVCATHSHFGEGD
jgi:site-specific DNA recombinase